MGKALANLKKVAILLALLTVAGLVADYMIDKDNFPAEYTLFPLCLFIITLLVMLVIWLFRTLIQKDR
jgi:hypothetical protein